MKAKAEGERRADEAKRMLERKEKEKRKFAAYRAEAINVETINIATDAFGFSQQQVNEARRKVKSPKMVDGASDVELAALGMVRAIEVEKTWMGPS